ncbi:MAG: hypothetical protein Q8M94_14570, partial [Ignavibacteria bacterium]|nr:hypothetical protein [Ignavibacteria bacterium]
KTKLYLTIIQGNTRKSIGHVNGENLPATIIKAAGVALSKGLTSYRQDGGLGFWENSDGTRLFPSLKPYKT